MQDAKLEAEKAQQIKKEQENKVSMAKEDAKIADVTAGAAKKRSEILNTNTRIIS